MQWVNAGGVRLNTMRMGSGPLLIMSHGLVTGSLASWYFTAAPALATRYTVVLYDLRGHGDSQPASSGYDLDTMATDLQHVIDAHRPHASGAGITLAGHSYGGLIALTYALRHPREVSRLALVDAPLPASRYVYPSLADEAPGAAFEDRLTEQLQQLTTAQPRRGRRARVRAAQLLLDSSLREDVRCAIDVPDEQLRRLVVPTLCLYGRKSPCAAAGVRLAALLPRAQLRWLACGHYVTTEAPADLRDELLMFFNARQELEHAIHDDVG